MKPKIQILIIEDFEPFRNNLAKHLQFIFDDSVAVSEYELELVLIESNLREGLSGPDYIKQGMQALQEKRWDLVICDWNVGTINNIPNLNLYTRDLYIYARECEQPIVLISGSDLSFREFTRDVAREKTTNREMAVAMSKEEFGVNIALILERVVSKHILQKDQEASEGGEKRV